MYNKAMNQGPTSWAGLARKLAGYSKRYAKGI